MHGLAFILVQPQHARTYFGVFLVITLLCSEPSAYQVVSDCVRERKVIIPFGGYVPVLHQREMQMAIKVCL